MNSDELCAVMNPRREKHFREHRALFTLFSFLLLEQYFHTCAREKHSRGDPSENISGRSGAPCAQRDFQGTGVTVGGYNFIAGDRIGRRCIRPTGVNPLRGESQQDEEGNGVGEEE